MEPGRVAPSADWADFTSKGRTLLTRLHELEEITSQRFIEWSSAGVGSALDIRFDKTFNLALEDAKALEALMVKKSNLELATEKRFYYAAMTAWALILFGSIAGIIYLTFKHTRAQEALSISRERLNSVLKCAADPIITVNLNGRIVYWNEAAETVFGFTNEEAVGREITLIMPERFREDHRAGLRHYASTGKGRIEGAVEVFARRKDGSELPVELSLSNWRDSRGRLFFTSIVRDITDRHKVRVLEKVTGIDYLTGAYNRAKFDELIKIEVERARRFSHSLSLLLFDLDDFKRINDNFGHMAGDEVLRDISAIVQKHMRKTNYFARWGGEEFMILAVETDVNGARALCERIRSEIATHNFTTVKSVTASFGVTQYIYNEPLEDFIKRADKALYKAKKRGKNCVSTTTTLPPAACA